MALYGPGLFTVHRAWGDPFFLLVERLLGIINLNRSSSAEGASLAFNILLGLVGSYFLSRKMPIAEFFNGLLRGPAFADYRDFPNSILAPLSLCGAALVPALDVPFPPPPSSSAGPSGLCGSVGPAPPCSPPNSSRILLTVI